MIFIVTKSYTIWLQTLKRLWNNMESYMAGWGLYRYPLIFLYVRAKPVCRFSFNTRWDQKSQRGQRWIGFWWRTNITNRHCVPCTFQPLLITSFFVWYLNLTVLVARAHLKVSTLRFSALKTVSALIFPLYYGGSAPGLHIALHAAC